MSVKNFTAVVIVLTEVERRDTCYAVRNFLQLWSGNQALRFLLIYILVEVDGASGVA